jgi:hypothetical protein
MGKINVFTVLIAAVVQLMVGYLWYGPHLFGDVVTNGGHAIDFLKTDGFSLLLIVLSSYGLTTILDMLVTTTGSKDIGDGVKLGLTFGILAIGFPMVMMLNLLGYSKIALLTIFGHMVVTTILTTLVVIKLKK